MRGFLALEVIVSVFLFISISLILLVCSISYLVMSSLVVEIQRLKSELGNSVKENLELATSEQIAEEISKRSSTPVILVKVSNTGILVDCFHVPPAMSVQLLEASAELVRQRIKTSMGDD